MEETSTPQEDIIVEKNPNIIDKEANLAIAREAVEKYLKNYKKNLSKSNEDPNTNLIVNYLPQSYTDENFRQLFLQHGNLSVIKLIKDVTGKSLCYGFVRYVNTEDAEKAVNSLNGQKIEDKILKVSAAKPASSEYTYNNLYIAGIPDWMTSNDLNEIFSHCGSVSSVLILTDRATNLSRGIGFVRMSNKNQADIAIASLNGIRFSNDGKPLVVKFADFQSSDKPRMTRIPPRMRMWNRERQQSTDNSYYESQGSYSRYTDTNVNSVNVNASPIYSPLGPVGYTNIPQMTIPQAELSYFHPIPTSQQGLYYHPLTKQPLYCLFVFGLPPQTNEQYLYQLFSPYGGIANLRIIRDFRSNLCKGLAFVNMTKYEEAEDAVEALNGAMIGNRSLQVKFKSEKVGYEQTLESYNEYEEPKTILNQNQEVEKINKVADTDIVPTNLTESESGKKETETSPAESNATSKSKLTQNQTKTSEGEKEKEEEKIKNV